MVTWLEKSRRHSLNSLYHPEPVITDRKTGVAESFRAPVFVLLRRTRRGLTDPVAPWSHSFPGTRRQVDLMKLHREDYCGHGGMGGYDLKSDRVKSLFVKSDSKGSRESKNVSNHRRYRVEPM